MKRFLLTTAALIAGTVSALAADMTPAQRAAADKSYAAAAKFDGVYIFGNVGYSQIGVDPDFIGDNLKGFTYGGGMGFQKQAGVFVIGAEGSIDNLTNVKLNGFGCDCLKVNLVGKVGVVLGNDFLVYGVGGGFWHNASTIGLPQTGWMVGAGVDWAAFGPVRIGPRYEYSHLAVPNSNLTVFSHAVKLNFGIQF